MTHSDFMLLYELILYSGLVICFGLGYLGGGQR